MSLLRVKTTECRVGVVGLYNAGKTVFLTSLVNHLQDHDPDRFPLGGRDVTIRKFAKRPPDPGWAEFNFAGNRDSLVHKGKWPAKTRDRFQYACQFERSDWTFSDCLLKLYDLPGERIADAAMAGRSFAEWSDHVLGVIRDDTSFRKCCTPFLELAEKPDAAEADLIATYKLSLANLILSFKPLVTPSTFLLDVDGKPAAPDTAENIAAGRYTGLGPDAQFVPLPFALRGSAFAAAFASRYDTYRDAVVMPFFRALKACHSLVVLVDVTMLLAGGVGMYDDTRQILRDLFHVLDPGENVLGTVGRHLAKVLLPHELRPGWITRVAFVAPKLDLVHPTDRDRMLTLLRRMAGKLAENRDGLNAEFFNCSAVVSTKPLPGGESERALVGVPLRGPDGRKIPPGPEQRFTPSGLPDDWPLAWGPGVYAFPEVYPQVPMRKDCPPEQINLDKVLDYVTDL
jgi:predicted YcjX-like family ATPase